jgi:hypothetical protein
MRLNKHQYADIVMIMAGLLVVLLVGYIVVVKTRDSVNLANTQCLCCHNVTCTQNEIYLIKSNQCYREIDSLRVYEEPNNLTSCDGGTVLS